MNADLQAHYELGFLAYPTWRHVMWATPMAQGAWREGWDDAKDLKDCEHRAGPENFPQWAYWNGEC